MQSERRIWFGDKLFSAANADLLSELKALGNEFDFLPVRKDESPTEVLLINILLREVAQIFLTSHLRRLRRSAVITEPSVVLPHLSWKIWEEIFFRIYWLGKISESGTLYLKPHVEIAAAFAPKIAPRRELAVIVNRNKISMIKGEQYSLRRQVINGASNIHVYGAGWSTSRVSRTLTVLKEVALSWSAPSRIRWGAADLFVQPKADLGETPDKHKTLENYKVAVVIENSREILTEKLIDAWVAGCIPVYVGPALGAFGIPPGLAVECEAKPEAVSKAILNALTLDYDEYVGRLGNWLARTEVTQQWGYHEVWGSIFESTKSSSDIEKPGKFRPQSR